MTRVLVVGVAVVDYVFFVDSFPTEGTKYRAKDSAIVGGGCAANAAVAIAKLSGEALLSARLGQDPVGDMIVNDLERDGVDLSLCDRSGKRSSFSSVFVDATGERMIMNYRGAGLTQSTDHMNAAPDVAAVLADTRWSEGALAAMELAKARSVPGILDVEAPAEHDAFAPASHLAFSLQGLSSFFPGRDPGDALKDCVDTYGGWACVTLGPDGVLSRGPDGEDQVPGYRVEAVDTLGAGDVWHGAFALKLAEGATESDAIRFANAVAAIKCTRRGGRAGTPTRAETEHFMKEMA